MKSTEFIIHNLNKWNKKYEGIQIKYGFDSSSNFHVVEISPEEIRRGNQTYMEEELKMWLDFMVKYPKEEMLISEPWEGNHISKILYSNFKG